MLVSAFQIWKTFRRQTIIQSIRKARLPYDQNLDRIGNSWSIIDKTVRIY